MPKFVNSQRRLDDISSAVRRIAITSGFGAITIRNVASELGTSTTTITHYVSDRSRLLEIAIEPVLALRRELIEDRLAAALSPSVIRSLVEAVVLDVSEEEHRLWFAMLVAAPSEPTVRRLRDEFNAWWDRVVREALRDADPTEVDDAIDVIDAIVDGLIVASLEEVPAWTVKRRSRALRSLLEGRTFGLDSLEPRDEASRTL